MTTSTTPESVRFQPNFPIAVAVATAVTFALLFGKPIGSLVADWWSDPEAGHGLLLGPVAIWLAWKEGIRPGNRPNAVLGLALIILAVLARYVAGLAAELFIMRGSALIGLAGLTTFFFGFRQCLAWWLPFTLLGLSVPIPEMVKSAMTLPLQLKASQVGAALLEMRQIPVRLTGNIIMVPGHQLFVTEACSGLRSLTALVSLAVLMGALSLGRVVSRVLLLAFAVVIAIGINAVRVFLTGFLVVYVDPKMGEGFMHLTEGWLLFLVSLGMTAAATWVFSRAERWLQAHAA